MGLSFGSSRAISWATKAMVPSGVPSSWAAAAASAPTAEARRSRSSAIWVAERASDIRRASSDTLET